MQFERSSNAKTRVTHAGIAIGVGIAGSFLARGPIALAPAAACPGAAEWLAVLAARAQPAIALGAWLPAANVLVAAAAVAVFTLLAGQITSAWLPAASAGLTLAALPIFARQLAPFPLAALAVSAIALLLITRRGAPPVATCLSLAATAAIVTPIALVASGVGAWTAARNRHSSSQRWLHGLIAGAAILSSAALVVMAGPHAPPWLGAPSLQSCLVPGPVASWAPAARLADVLSPAGILAIGLVLFAAFTHRRAVRQPVVWMAGAFAIGPIVIGGPADERALAPAVVAFWLLVAVGLTEVLRACRPGLGGRAAAACFVTILPALQIARSPEPSWIPSTPAGHDRVTLNDIHQLLAAMPLSSGVVEEDAIVDVLLRASNGTWQRMGKSLVGVRRDAGALTGALRVPGLHVFALPIAQAELQHVGFRLVDAPTLPGASEVLAGGSCQTLDPEWRTLPGLAASTSFSMVATTPADEGPLVAYMTFDGLPALQALDWPATAMHGFNAVYYGATAEDQARLTRDAQDDELPRDWASGATPPFVARFELWRVPGAPARLAVGMGQTPGRTMAHLETSAPLQLALCPAFPHAVHPLAPGGSQK